MSGRRVIGISILWCILGIFSNTFAQITPQFNTTGQAVETNYLNWNAFSGASQYQIYWSTSPGVTTASNMIPIGTASILGHFHTGLVGNQTYYYRIRALDAMAAWTLLSPEISVTALPQYAQNAPGGNGEGHASSKTCVTNLNGGVFNPSYTDLTVYNSFESNQIHWQPYSGATSYLLQFSTDNTTWTTLQNTLSTSFIHTGLIGNTTYFYRLTPQLSGTCTVNPNVSMSGIAIPLSGFFNGGNGDGHSMASDCRSKLDGTDDPPITDNPVVYPGFLENNIFWQATSGAINYTLQFSTNIAGPFTELAAATTSLSFNHPSLIAGQTYYYRVRANFASGCPYNFSAPVLGIPMAPSIVHSGGNGDGHDCMKTCPIKLDGTSATSNSQNITVYASTEQNLICWPQEPGASNYTLDFSQNIGGPYTTLTTTTLLQFAHTPVSLIPGTSYFYRVTANLSTGCPLNPSTPVLNTAMPQYQVYPGGVGDGHSSLITCVIKLDGLSAAPVSQSITVYPSIEQNLICWPQESGASGYNLEVATSLGGPYNSLYTGTLLSFAHVPTNLTAEVQYFYRVTALLPTGCPLNPSAVQSSVAQAQNFIYNGGVADGHANMRTCLLKLSGLPDAPQSQAITVYSSVEQILITWPSEAGASSYILEFSPNGASGWTQLLNSNVTSFLDNISPGGVSRFYRVTAILSNGCSLQPSVVNTGNSVPNYPMYPGGIADGHANNRSCTFIRLDQATITAQGSTTFCQGGSVTLSASVAVLYAWYINGVAIPGANAATYNATQSGSYTVDVFNIYSCNATSMTINVVVNSAPGVPASVTANPSGFSCNPVTLTASAPPAGINYYWQGTNPAGTSTSLPASVPYIANTTGDYYLNSQNTITGCWSITNTLTSVTVAPYPMEITPNTNNHICNIPGQNNWVHITAPDDKVIASVNTSGQNLGFINAGVYVSTAVSNQFDGSNEFMRRHFVIQPQNPVVGQVPVRLYYTNADFNALLSASQTSSTPFDDVASPMDLIVIKYQGPTEDGVYNMSDATEQLTLQPAAIGSDFMGNYLEILVDGFSEFWIRGTNIIALPVSWLSQDVKCENGRKKILWSTATESNNSEFVIQKSTDLIQWSEIGRMPGAGNSNTILNYSYLYNDPDQVSYFRIKQIDFNGMSAYSAVFSGNCPVLNTNTEVSGAAIVESMLHIKFTGIPDNAYSVRLLDMGGKLIYRSQLQKTNSDMLSFSMGTTLAKGVYLVELWSQSDKVKVIKVLY